MNAARCIDLLTLAACTFAITLAPLAAQRGVHADETLGFKVRPPAGWSCLPARGDRGSLVALYCSPRTTSPKSGGGQHVPTLRVLYFAKSNADASADVVDGAPRTTPYRDFDDYVGRGFARSQVRSRTEGAVGKAQGKLWNIAIPRESGNLTLYCATVDVDGGELALEFEVLDDEFERNQKDFEKTIVSFSLEGGGKARTVVPMPPWQQDLAAWQKKSAADRAKDQAIWEKDYAAAATAAIEPGWKEHKSKYWVVLSQADAKDTKAAIKAAELARVWAESRLATVSDARPAAAVLRVFISPVEYTAFRSRDTDPREFEAPARELYYAIDPDAGSGDGFGGLFRAVLEHYLNDKDPRITKHTPRWLDNGIWELMRSSRLASKGIEFYAGEVEMGRMRYHQQHDSLPAIWNLIQESMQPSPADGGNEDTWGYTPECARVLRWLEQGGNAALKQDDFLSAYFRAIGTAVADVGPNPTRDVDWARLPDADGPAVRKKFYEWRDRLLGQINTAVVPLGVGDWEVANTAWAKFNADFGG